MWRSTALPSLSPSFIQEHTCHVGGLGLHTSDSIPVWLASKQSCVLGVGEKRRAGARAHGDIWQEHRKPSLKQDTTSKKPKKSAEKKAAEETGEDDAFKVLQAGNACGQDCPASWAWALGSCQAIVSNATWRQQSMALSSKSCSFLFGLLCRGLLELAFDQPCTEQKSKSTERKSQDPFEEKKEAPTKASKRKSEEPSKEKKEPQKRARKGTKSDEKPKGTDTKSAEGQIATLTFDGMVRECY